MARKTKRNDFLIVLGIILLAVSIYFIGTGISFEKAFIGAEARHHDYIELQDGKLIYEGSYSKTGRDCETSLANIILASPDNEISQRFLEMDITVETWWASFKRFDLSTDLEEFHAKIPNSFPNEGLEVDGYWFGSARISSKPADNEQCIWNYRAVFTPKESSPVPTPIPEQPKNETKCLKEAVDCAVGSSAIVDSDGCFVRCSEVSQQDDKNQDKNPFEDPKTFVYILSGILAIILIILLIRKFA